MQINPELHALFLVTSVWYYVHTACPSLIYLHHSESCRTLNTHRALCIHTCVIKCDNDLILHRRQRLPVPHRKRGHVVMRPDMHMYGVIIFHTTQVPSPWCMGPEPTVNTSYKTKHKTWGLIISVGAWSNLPFDHAPTISWMTPYSLASPKLKFSIRVWLRRVGVGMGSIISSKLEAFKFI